METDNTSIRTSLLRRELRFDSRLLLSANRFTTVQSLPFIAVPYTPHLNRLTDSKQPLVGLVGHPRPPFAVASHPHILARIHSRS
jgi:hypothetical protein